MLVNFAANRGIHLFFQFLISRNDVVRFVLCQVRLEEWWLDRLLIYVWLLRQKDISCIIFEFLQLPFAKVFNIIFLCMSLRSVLNLLILWICLIFLCLFFLIFLILFLSLHLYTNIFRDKKSFILLCLLDEWLFYFFFFFVADFLSKWVLVLFWHWDFGQVWKNILVVLDIKRLSLYDITILSP